MEIQDLRKEFNQLLENINKHSERFTDKKHLPSLEINVMLSKINKLQEVAAVMKHSTTKIEELRGKFDEDDEDNELTTDTIELSQETTIIEEQTVLNEENTVINDEPEKQELIDENIPEEPIEEPTKPISNIEQLPIAKLVDALSLNDRYLYANELFGKDMGAFNEAVKNLDTCANFDEAQTILMSVGTTNNWDVENEDVLSFTNLVERRFL